MITSSPAALHSQTEISTQNTDFAYAEKLAQDGYVELAIAQYKEFLQRFPGDQRIPEAVCRIADSYFSLKNYAEARTFYEKLLLRHGTSPFAQDAIFRIGECFALEGEIIKAAQNFERFAILNESLPLSANAFLKAGAMYLQAPQGGVKGRRLLYKVIENYREMEEAQAEANLLLLQDFVAAGEYHRGFDLANAFLGKFSKITATSKVWLIKAQLHEKLGQIPKALETLESIRAMYKDTAAARFAMLRLAELYFKFGDRAKAHAILAQFNAAANDSLSTEAAFLQARLYLEEEKFADALTVIQALGSDHARQIELNLFAGKIHFTLQDYVNALDRFEEALQSVDPDNGALRCTVLYKAAQAAFELGNGAKANGYIKQALPECVSQNVQADLNLLQADVYFELYEDAARASRIYAAFIENHPEHREIDDAQAKLAKCYAFLHQWNLAQSEWRRLVQNYPASVHFAMAKNHLELIQKYFLPDYIALVENMIGYPGVNGAQIDPKLRQAELHFRFHNYQKAIPLLKQVIGGENDADARSQAMYLLGSTYFALGDIAYLQRSDDASAWLDSAHVVLQHVRSKYGDAFDAPTLDLKLSLLALRNQNTPFATLDSISIEHRDDLNYAAIHSHVLTEHLHSAVQGDSTAQATYLNRLFTLSSQPNNHFRNKANLLVAKFALMKQDTAMALLNLEKIVRDNVRDPDRVEGELLFAKLLGGSGRISEAMQMLNSLHSKYFYSAFADSVLFYLASFSYQKGRYQEAVDFLIELRSRHAAISGKMNAHLWAEAQYLQAYAYEKMGRDLIATGAYLNFLQNYPADARASTTLLALGRMAEKLQAIPLAKGYYRDVSKLYSNRIEDVRQAKMRLADLEFRLENYETARILALETLQANPPFEDERALTKLAIIANLRQGKLQSTESEIKNFKSKFDDDNEAYAEIRFELGDYYIRKKNFKRADKIFKNVRKKFKGTNYGIQGEFGLGKSLLYQAKTEDALEVLAEIPRKYPGHPFLRVVFLNLGDFYKDQQQWGNAIQAFNKVLADSTYDQYHKAALAKLSELYQSTGMYDASLVYTRKYIELFPNTNENMKFKMRIGSLLRELKQYDEATKYYRDLLPYAHGDDALAIQYFIGLSYFESKKYELAVAELLKLRYNNKPTKFPWRTTAIYRAGEAYLHLNNYDRAREMYDYVLRMEGANSQMGSFALRKIAQIDEMLKSLQNDRQKS